jgi:hypothetical protein
MTSIGAELVSTVASWRDEPRTTTLSMAVGVLSASALT